LLGVRISTVENGCNRRATVDNGRKRLRVIENRPGAT